MIFRRGLKKIALGFVGLVLAVSVSNFPVKAASRTATLKVIPATQTVNVGDQFTFDIRLDTGGQATSLVAVQFTYDRNYLTYVSADASNPASVFDSSIKSPDPSNGTIEFERTRLDAGFNGSDGQLFRFTFKATAAGNTPITLDKANSQVLAYSDSVDILNAVSNGSVTLNNKSTSTTNNSTTTTTTADKSKSSVTVSKNNASADGTATDELTITLKDSSGKAVTSRPAITVPANVKLASLTLSKNDWIAKLTSTSDGDKEVTVKSGATEIAKATVNFTKAAATTPPAAQPTQPTPEPNTPLPETPQSPLNIQGTQLPIPALAVPGFVVVCLLGAGVVWWLKHRQL